MDTKTDFLFELFSSSFPAELAKRTIEVGLSGGLDSVVLLHLMLRLKSVENFELKAVHVHHGLSPNADSWADFCQEYCSKLDIPLRIVRVKVDKGKKGIEAAAREARYRVFSDGLCDAVALAHHADDQIETFMLGMLRGGGLRALAGMPEVRYIGKTAVWRPLLPFGRDVLAHYADAFGLAHIEDESNGDTRFLRNWLRHEAVPLFRNRVSGFDGHIRACMDRLRDDLLLLDEIIGEDWQLVCKDGIFSLKAWRSFTQNRRRHLLRHFLLASDIALPSQHMLMDFERVLYLSGRGEWRFGGSVVAAYRERLFVLRNSDTGAEPWITGEVRGRLKDILNDNGFSLARAEKGFSSQLLEEECIIRTMTNDDTIFCGGMDKRAKRLLQENHVLPLVRKKWPIITNSENKCLAVVNLQIDGKFQSTDGFLPVYEKFQQFIGEPNPHFSVF